MLNKTPAKGMRDILPEDYAAREKVLNQIKETYARYGFTQIETPCVEDLRLLTSRQGGENEKLIFKILKRGEKLSAAEQGDWCDLGLRYDLTLPLSRFYANHMSELPAVFKSLQIGNVWRAERPQKGRYRQFVQCDIDIIGEKSILAEAELIRAAVDALTGIGFSGFTVRINDRRILLALGKNAGFAADELGAVLISLDKLDKIGCDGVIAELTEQGFALSAAQALTNVVSAANTADDPISALCEAVELPADAKKDITDLFSLLQSFRADCRFCFDPTLVRGMGYYTGAIFEISVDGYGVSVAGGGRYDEMMGKYLNQSVPACGFSIGFERIMSLLEKPAEVTPQKDKVCFILEKDLEISRIAEVFAKTDALRSEGKVCNVLKRMKNFARQLESLRKEGYGTIVAVSSTEERIVD